MSVGMVALLSMACLASAASAGSALKWRPRLLVDPPDGGHQLRAVSCPSNKLCAVVDAQGNVLTSTHPTGGVSTWKLKHVDNRVLLGISCVGSLCAAVDTGGDAIVSTNAASKTASWSLAQIDPGHAITAISCPSAHLCIAGDSSGQILTSTQPAGGASKWKAKSVDPGVSPLINVLTAVSCPSTSFCVAGDNHGNSVSSTNPAGGIWTRHPHVDSTNEFNALSCPSRSLCVGVDTIDTGGQVISSTTPATGAPWKAADVDKNFQTPFGMSCPSTSLCVGVDDSMNAFTSTQPTGGPSAWRFKNVDHRWGFYGISCTPKALCVGVDAGGNVVVGQLPLPDTQITGTSINKSKHTAKFSFKASGTASGFQCALRKRGHKASFSQCRSPATYKHLSPGSYTFLVRALNLAGSDRSPASKSFTM
jgi:hypothetical protein